MNVILCDLCGCMCESTNVCECLYLCECLCEFVNIILCHL